MPAEKLDEQTKEKLHNIFKQSIPYDPRFPNQNQTKNCWQNYIDYHRCLKKKNGDEEYCSWYKNAYLHLCPMTWWQHWDEQREEGSWACQHLVDRY